MNQKQMKVDFVLEKESELRTLRESNREQLNEAQREASRLRDREDELQVRDMFAFVKIKQRLIHGMCRNMKFILSVDQDKFHISKHPCIVLFII